VTIADRTWDNLPAEIHARVMAATAHAQIRRIEHSEAPDADLPQGVWTVDALAGDRFVHQVLGLRADRSVFEETRTFLTTEILEVSFDPGGATVVVPGASGPEAMRVPDPIGRDLERRHDEAGELLDNP
jgi:hypothetical protein